MTHSKQLFLVNWRSASYVLIQGIPKHRVALIPDYVVLTLDDMWDGDRLAVVPVESLASNWAPVHDVDKPSNIIEADDLSLIQSEPLSLEAEIQLSQLSVHESPIRPGLFRILLYLEGRDFLRLRVFDLAITSSGVQLSPKPSMTTLWAEEIITSGSGEIAFSGHTLLWHEGDWSISSPKQTQIKDTSCGAVNLEGHGDHLDLSPYSGALTYSTKEAVVILYYE
jgi:hypothetical protein